MIPLLLTHKCFSTPIFEQPENRGGRKSAHSHIMIKQLSLFKGQPFSNFVLITQNKRLAEGKQS